MHTAICDELGIEFPIFAFTHCRDVVVAVSKAGGFGVLGAVGFTPEQLEIELNWIDEHIGDHTYGVDIVIPNKYEGMDSRPVRRRADEDAAATWCRRSTSTSPSKILADHGVPVEDSDDDALQLLGWTEATATPQVEVALKHPKVTLIANALGTPPADMIKHIHDEGRKVAALCGSPSQARKHADAGRRHHHRPGRRGRRTLRRGRLDRAVAAGRQGGRAGAGAGRRRHRQRPADRRGAGAGRAGRMDRLAVADGRGGREHRGAAGRVRQGRAAATPCAAARSPASRHGCCATTGPRRGRSRTTRSRSECRCSTWFPAWPSLPRTSIPNETVDVAFNPVGQVVGQFTKVEKTSAVIERWVQEYLEATTPARRAQRGRHRLTYGVGAGGRQAG